MPLDDSQGVHDVAVLAVEAEQALDMDARASKANRGRSGKGKGSSLYVTAIVAAECESAEALDMLQLRHEQLQEQHMPRSTCRGTYYVGCGGAAAMQSGRRHEKSRKITGLHVTSECLLMDSEQANDGTLREPERAQGTPDTDGRRQPSEHVASAAGQVAQQLCLDAGRVALFVARFAEDLGRLAASDKGWNAVELGGESSFEGVWGP